MALINHPCYLQFVIKDRETCGAMRDIISGVDRNVGGGVGEASVCRTYTCMYVSQPDRACQTPMNNVIRVQSIIKRDTQLCISQAELPTNY